MKPKLKPPGSKRLKLKCDILLSTSAFKFNLRRHTVAAKVMHVRMSEQAVRPPCLGFRVLGFRV